MRNNVMFLEDVDLLDSLSLNDHDKFVSWFAELNSLSDKDASRAPATASA